MNPHFHQNYYVWLVHHTHFNYNLAVSRVPATGLVHLLFIVPAGHWACSAQAAPDVEARSLLLK